MDLLKTMRTEDHKITVITGVRGFINKPRITIDDFCIFRTLKGCNLHSPGFQPGV